MEKIKMLSMAGLRERGWTASMITSLLGEPDALKKNPHYAKAAPMRCYIEERVVSAETTPDFAAAKAKAVSRSNGAKKAADTKRDDLLKRVQEMRVSVKTKSLVHVRAQAIRAYNDWNDDVVSSDAEPVFLERLSVNYIRHNLTTYDAALEEVAGRVGIEDAVKEIRRKIYGAIAERYPELGEECSRQMAKRGI